MLVNGFQPFLSPTQKFEQFDVNNTGVLRRTVRITLVVRCLLCGRSFDIALLS